ncbi:lipopolysaccharide biosynthesis protein [Lachnospira multipara]|uniref:lipopolysaccharide biosynthesis protein n=1 Tax=Lachnospira multipara TaxID=28051 RepID=UPI000484BB63|nr:oligosaccharide flippase family protein [Lachnospira multipara]
MKRGESLAKNTLILSLGTIIPKITSFITLPIITLCLTKNEIGFNELIMMFSILMLPVATLQIQTAAFRFLIDVRDDEEEIKKIISSIIVFTFITSLIALVVVFLCLYKEDLYLRFLICLYYLADIFVNTLRQICRGLGKNGEYSKSIIVSSFSTLVFIIALVFILSWGLIGVVASSFLSSFIAFIYLFFKIKLYRFFSMSFFNKEILKKMLSYTIPLIPNSISGWLMRLADRLVVTVFMGVSANAVYSLACKIPNLIDNLQNTFVLAWQENASIVSKDSDAGEYYTRVFHMLFNLITGSLGLLIAISPVLFKLLIKGDYEEAYFQMPILFMAMFFLGLSTFLGGIYLAFKKTKSIGLTTTVAAVINLVFDISLIRYLGLYAASISTMLAYIFLFLFRIIDVQKIIRIRVNISHMILMIIILLIECGIFYLDKIYLDTVYLKLVNCLIAVVLFLGTNWEFIRMLLRWWFKNAKGE